MFSLFFRYKGRIYDKCVTHTNQGVPWCATSTDSTTLEMASNSKGNCMGGNKVNDCPVGFRWAYSEGTCYRVSLIDGVSKWLQNCFQLIFL
jgi:hypothetical protein